MLYQPLGIDAGGSGCNAAFPFDKGVLKMKKMNYPADYAVLSNEEMTYTTVIKNTVLSSMILYLNILELKGWRM